MHIVILSLIPDSVIFIYSGLVEPIEGYHKGEWTLKN